uniref:Uncharacterized protein n=1 Tax=Arundo donax TaxID=35708 RepID=A0A0A9AQR8_ARUDO
METEEEPDEQAMEVDQAAASTEQEQAATKKEIPMSKQVRKAAKARRAVTGPSCSTPAWRRWP